MAFTNTLERLGARATRDVDAFGDFCRFCGRSMGWLMQSGFSVRGLRLLGPQLYHVATRSLPVVMVTGMFVGMVLAVQTIMQFKAVNMEAQMGTIIILSVLRELGPVLSGVMLAGRVGGALTAELGTMRVTEQIDALRAMGTDPLRILVVPRFLACVIALPILVLYASVMGIAGGYLMSVFVYDVNAAEFWRHSVNVVGYFDIFYGPIKAVFFGAALSLICCYKGFHCKPGAAGVGKACTESFVASCMAILGLDFFIGVILNTLYMSIYGVKVLLG